MPFWSNSRSSARARRRPCLEPLEDRLAPGEAALGWLILGPNLAPTAPESGFEERLTASYQTAPSRPSISLEAEAAGQDSFALPTPVNRGSAGEDTAPQPGGPRSSPFPLTLGEFLYAAPAGPSAVWPPEPEPDDFCGAQRGTFYDLRYRVSTDPENEYPSGKDGVNGFYLMGGQVLEPMARQDWTVSPLEINVSAYTGALCNPVYVQEDLVLTSPGSKERINFSIHRKPIHLRHEGGSWQIIANVSRGASAFLTLTIDFKGVEFRGSTSGDGRAIFSSGAEADLRIG